MAFPTGEIKRDKSRAALPKLNLHELQSPTEMSKWPIFLARRALSLIRYLSWQLATKAPEYGWLCKQRATAGDLLPFPPEACHKGPPVSVGKTGAMTSQWGVCFHFAFLKERFPAKSFLSRSSRGGTKTKRKELFPISVWRALKVGIWSRRCLMRGCTSGWIRACHLALAPEIPRLFHRKESRGSLVSSRWSGIVLRAVPLLSLKGIWDSVVKSSVARCLRGSILAACKCLRALDVLPGSTFCSCATRDGMSFGRLVLVSLERTDVLEEWAVLPFPWKTVLREKSYDCNEDLGLCHLRSWFTQGFWLPSSGFSPGPS